MAEPATPKKSVRTCNMCRARMSTIDHDPHLICISCRGVDCNFSDRCNECVTWTDDCINAYVKHRKSLERKRLSKAKCKKSDFDVICTGPGSHALSSEDVSADGGADDATSSVSGSASATMVDQIVDRKLANFSNSLRADLDKDWGARMKSMTDSIIKAMDGKLDNFRQEFAYDDDETGDFVNDPSISAPQGVSVRQNDGNVQPNPSHSTPPDGSNYQGTVNVEPGHSRVSANTDQSPQYLALRRHVQSLCDAGIISHDEFNSMLDRALVKVSGSGPVGQIPPSSAPVASVASSAGLSAGSSVGRPPEPGVGATGASGTDRLPCPRSVVIGGSEATRPMDDDALPDLASSAEFRELIDFVYGIFPESRPSQEKPPPEPFLREHQGDSEATASSRLALYDRFSRIRDDAAEKLSEASKDLKRPSTVLHRRRPSYKIGLNVLAASPILNDGFGRMCPTRPSSSSDCLVPLEEIRRLESSIIGLQEAQSFSAWLLAALFKHVRDNEFLSPQPALFNRLMSSLSTAMMDQSIASHSMSSFCSVTRRTHFLKFASTLTDGQKARLLGSNPFQKDLFDPSVLEEVLSEFDRSSATKSHLDVSQAVAKGFLFGKRQRDPSPSVAGPSGVPPGATVSPVVPPAGSAPPLDYSSRGRGNRLRGFRGRGRGGRRGKGSSGFSKPSSSEKGFRK